MNIFCEHYENTTKTLFCKAVLLLQGDLWITMLWFCGVKWCIIYSEWDRVGNQKKYFDDTYYFIDFPLDARSTYTPC